MESSQEDRPHFRRLSEPTAFSSAINEGSSFRWLVLAVILVSQLGLVSILFAPAAVAQLLMDDLRITHAEFGLVMSVASVTVMVCVFLGSVLVDRMGPKTGLFLGLLALGIGGGLVVLARDFFTLLLTRVIQGVGIAITYPVLGALIMAWFEKGEKPVVNTLFAACAFLGTGGAFVLTTELLARFGNSWNAALSVYGFAVLVLALGWFFLGREKRVASFGGGAGLQPLEAGRDAGSLSRALRMSVAWTLTIGIFAVAWVYNMYFSFIPLFLQNERGLGIVEAGRLGSLLPFSGVAGVFVFGLLAKNGPLRKHLLWVSCAVVLVGGFGIFYGDGLIMRAGLVVAGFGLSGFLPVSVTYMMALPDMSPSLVAAFLVMINVATYLAGFTAPFLVGWLSQTRLGLTHSLALFTLIELLAIAMFLRLPPTD